MKIALAFSGGGYRAASFSLGVLSFLARVKYKEGTLLDHVHVLSTVSGGTITGARYTLGIKRSENMDTIFDSLYKFMTHVDLVTLALDRLISGKGWEEHRTKSLICAAADIYDAYLFENEKFGRVLSDAPEIHLKHISFNSTEFCKALPFRFLISEELLQASTGESQRGVIGNHFFRISREIAEHIRLADILAASSCFPGGFEPIKFPDDFILPPHHNVRLLKEQKEFPLALMDGGIVDNQGIEPILLAEKRIKRKQLSKNETTDDLKSIDLIILSDVASPYMEQLIFREHRKGGWRKLTPKLIFSVNSILLLASIAGVYFGFLYNLSILLLISAMVLTISTIVFMLAAFIKSVPTRLHIPNALLAPIGKLLKLDLGTYNHLLGSRLDSLLKMSNEVFLKHIRRLNYQTIFRDPEWKNRRIMNGIYELRHGEKKLQEKLDSGILPAELVPNTIIRDVASKATAMNTTLWFTPAELTITPEQPYHLADSIIACGQFTCCWNLLEYISKIKKDQQNTTEELLEIIDCEGQLLAAWEKFKNNPYWFLQEYYLPNKVL